jgi:hypothetical protein
MADSRSVPRLLQRPPAPSSPDPSSTAAREARTPGESRQKGDLRTQVEAPKPSRERETGDLETTERESHGRA